MKKITLLALSLVSLLGFLSCSKAALDTPSEENEIRRVNFLAHMEEEVEVTSKTGVKLKMIHTWVNTKEEDIHLFEKDQKETVIEGEDITFKTESPYENATLSAGFYNSIIVDPTKTKASKSFTYYGVVSHKNENGKFEISDVQYPNKESWIDPEADFIVGKTKSFSTTQSEKTIDFSFSRPISVSRLAFTNLDGSFLKEVTIYSNDELTGSASYSDIDFDNCSVNFSNGSKSIKMVFPENSEISGTTYANFVSIIGSKYITCIEVVTDEWIYTRNVETTAVFNKAEFKNIAMDMTIEEGKCSRISNKQQPLKFVKSGNVIVSDTYDLSSGSPYVSPELQGAVGTVTYASDEPDIADVNQNTGAVTPKTAGVVKITATAAATEEKGETSISYTLTITSSAPVEQTLSFGEITEFSHTYGDEFTEPKLTGAMTTVTYASDDEDIATVNNGGEVTFTGTKGGAVNITATAKAETVGDVTYAKGEASYKINVTIPPKDKYFVKVTTAPTDWSGTYLFVDETNNVAFNYSDGTNYKASVTISNGKIKYDDNTKTYAMVVESSTVGAGKYDVTAYNGQYLYGYKSNAQILNDGNTQSSKQYYNVFSGNGDVNMYSTRGDDGSINYFGYESSAFGYEEEATSRTIQLYLLEGSVKTSRNLAFETSSINKQLEDGDFANTLNGVTDGGVTFTSSETSVATVNSSTGQISIVGKGTTTITASCPATETYAKGTATFTLRVVKKLVTYQKVTTAPTDWSGTYLFVDETAKVAFAHDQTNYTIGVTISNNKIVESEDYGMKVSKSTTASLDSESGDTDPYDVTTFEGDYYMYSYNNNSTTLTKKASRNNKYYNVFSINNGNVTMKSTKSGSSKNYFRYSDSKFAYKEEASTATFQIYKALDE